MITQFFYFPGSLKNETLCSFQYCTPPERNFRCFLRKILFKNYSKSSEAATWKCPEKKMFLKISQNQQENTCVEVSFLIKLQETSSQVVSREFCEILKNTCFVISQGLLLNPRTYNIRFLETTTIAKNVENVRSINLFEQQCQGISGHLWLSFHAKFF